MNGRRKTKFVWSNLHSPVVEPRPDARAKLREELRAESLELRATELRADNRQPRAKNAKSEPIKHSMLSEALWPPYEPNDGLNNLCGPELPATSAFWAPKATQRRLDS